MKLELKKIFIVLLTLMQVGCGDQFTCGYHPETYKLSEMFSIEVKFLNVDKRKISSIINQYGIENKYCLANGSREQSSMGRYLVNIQLINENFAFYVYGTDKLIFNFEVKNSGDYTTELQSFCNLIKPLISDDKVRYYPGKGKLCGLN